MVDKQVFVSFVLTATTRLWGVLLVAVGTGWGQWSVTEEAKLVPSDPGEIDAFGISVATYGDTAIVGVPGDNNAGGSNAGSAYVFVRSGANWTEQQKLTASDAEAGDNFGASVAIFGDTLIVGAYQETSGQLVETGAAYVFVRSGTIWTEQQKLTASDAGQRDWFGNSVALYSDTALIGANKDNLAAGNDAGSAYVFVRSGTTWTEQQKLTASDAGLRDWFGFSLALFEETAVIGAYLDDHTGGDDAGSAYVFVRSGTLWTEQQKMTASDAGPQESFGVSVGIWVDTVVVGAGGDDHAAGVDAGSAYVYVRNGATWVEQQKLIASDAAAQDTFGGSVGILADRLVVGANGDDHAAGANAGSAYEFVGNGGLWVEKQKLTASDAMAGDMLGYAAALSSDTALIGAWGDDAVVGVDAGSAYVFRLAAAFENYCTAGTSASGCQALLSATGTASATASSGFTLSAATVEGQKDGLFFFGTNGQQANPWGNGTSYQCVIPPVVRTPTMAGVGTIGLCDGSFALDLNALWCPSCPKPAKNPGAGAVVQAQLWYRDPLSTSNQTTSLSDAVEFGVGP